MRAAARRGKLEAVREFELEAIRRELDARGLSLVTREVRRGRWLAYVWDRSLPLEEAGGGRSAIGQATTRSGAAAALLRALNQLGDGTTQRSITETI
jgi:hypothetical protein